VRVASRPNWSRALPRPLVIPDVMTLKTLADVRELMRHVPADRRDRPTWRHVAAQLTQAAAHRRRHGRRCLCAVHGADFGGRRMSGTVIAAVPIDEVEIRKLPRDTTVTWAGN
jgi:hypothetical protein